MRSRSRRELLLLAFGAVAEGVWCGALAAAVTGGPGSRHIVFATAVVYASAVVALRSGAGRRPGGLARVLVVVLAAGAAGTLLAAGEVWDAANPVPWIVVDVAYAALLVIIGIGLGGAPLAPGVATRRAIRAFALLCLILAGATLAGSPPSWAMEALAVSLVAGGLFVAAARYETLTALTPAAEPAPAWPWLLAVLGVTLLVVSAGVIVTEVLQVDLVARALAAAGALAGYVLAWVGYVIGYVGAALIRAVGGLLSLLDLHRIEPPKQPASPGLPDAFRSPKPGSVEERLLLRIVMLVALTALAVGASFGLVAFALRRFRRALPDEVEEERERVTSLRAAAAAGAGRLAGRLRRLVTRTPPSRTPAESVRRRYAELERRLAKAGHARAPGTTVRAFLAAVSAEADAAVSDASNAARGPVLDLAGALAGLYELARYSTEPVDAVAASTFERLALDLTAAVTAT